jgi:DNA-binding CsgD family transcriptional regulator
LRFQTPATVLSGDLGLGKTTVLREVAERSDRSVKFITCRSNAGAIPYEPLQALVWALHGAQTPELRLSSPADAVALRDLLAHEAADEPQLFILDDAHWADAQSLDMLPYLVDRLQDYPVRWIIASRPGYKAVDALVGELLRSSVAQTVELAPMSDPEIAAMISEFDLPTQANVETIVREARGNPLFAGLLASTNQQRTSTAEAIVAEQVAALDADSRVVAQAMATIDRPCSLETLSLVLQKPASPIERSLATLVARRVVAPTNGVAQLSHAIWSHVLLESAAPDLLASFHGRLATLTDNTAERARHLYAAGDVASARDLFAGLAWQSLEARRAREARDFAGAALSMSAIDASGMCSDASLSALLALTKRFADQLSKRLPVEARKEQWKALDPAIVARLESAHDHFYRSYGFLRLDEVDRLCVAAEGADAPYIAAGLLYATVQIHEYRSEFQSSLALADRIDGIVPAGGNAPEHLLARIARAATASMSNDNDGGLAVLEEIAREAHAQGLPDLVIEAAVRANEIAMRFQREERVLALSDFAFGLPDASPWARRRFLASYALLQQNIGSFETALTLAHSLGEDLSDLEAATRHAPVFVKAYSFSHLGFFADAAKTLDAWNRGGDTGAADVMTLTAGLHNELRERYDDAVKSYSDLIRMYASAGFIGNNLLAALGIFRVAYFARSEAIFSLAQTHRSLFERAKAQHPIYCTLQAGYAAAFQGRKAEGASLIREGAELPGLNPFERAYALLTAAELTSDLELFESCAATFSQAGAAFMVERTMNMAAELKVKARPPKSDGPLSQRERSVALLVAAGKTNPEIAGELSISRRTVETHVARILTKLELRSRIDVAVWMARQ